jgi:hypothetical protein
MRRGTFDRSAGRWKLVCYTEGAPPLVKLADLESDPNPCEQVELRMRTEDAEDLAYLLARLEAFLSA